MIKGRFSLGLIMIRLRLIVVEAMATAYAAREGGSGPGFGTPCLISCSCLYNARVELEGSVLLLVERHVERIDEHALSDTHSYQCCLLWCLRKASDLRCSQGTVEGGAAVAGSTAA